MVRGSDGWMTCSRVMHHTLPCNRTDQEQNVYKSSTDFLHQVIDYVHFVLLALECYRRAAQSSQTSNLDIQLLSTAAMLSRTMGCMLTALDQRQDEPLWVGPPAGR